MSYHAPIYNVSELAGLLARHDTEHPTHGDGCDCHNGLIPALRRRVLIAHPMTHDSSNDPKPYVPPDTRRAEPLASQADRDKKPWLNRREGETREQYNHRVNHSCYNCGVHILDEVALDKHEDNCARQGKQVTG